MIFQREQDAVLNAVEAWIRRFIPSRVIIGIVAGVLFVSFGIYICSKIYDVYKYYDKSHDADVTTAMTEIVEAGTGTFFTTFEVPHLEPFDSATLQPFEGPVTNNMEIKQEVKLQNCLLTMTTRWTTEIVESDKPSQLRTTVLTDKFLLGQVLSLGIAKKEGGPFIKERDGNTRGVYLILKGESYSSKQILEVDKIPHHVPNRPSIRIYMYAQNFDKIRKEITLLAKTCGANDMIFIDLDL
jgi:hypothetical protein